MNPLDWFIFRNLSISLYSINHLNINFQSDKNTNILVFDIFTNQVKSRIIEVANQNINRVALWQYSIDNFGKKPISVGDKAILFNTHISICSYSVILNSQYLIFRLLYLVSQWMVLCDCYIIEKLKQGLFLVVFLVTYLSFSALKNYFQSI